MTREEKIEFAMKNSPNFKKFIESGESEQVARLVSMAYLIISVGNSYNEEAIEIMEKYDLVHKKIKTKANNLAQSFDAYHKVINELMNKESRLQLCVDFDDFKAFCDKYMNQKPQENE